MKLGKNTCQILKKNSSHFLICQNGHGIAVFIDDVLSPALTLHPAQSLYLTLGPNNYIALTNVDSQGSTLPGLLRIAPCMLH